MMSEIQFEQTFFFKTKLNLYFFLKTGLDMHLCFNGDLSVLVK